MIQSAFHRAGDHSRPEVSPGAFRFGTKPRFPGAARVHDDVAVRPTSAKRYDREHDPSKGRFLACSGGPRRRVVHSTATNRHGSPLTFVSEANDGSIPVAPVLVRRRSLRSAGEGERASRASDDSTDLASGLHRLHGPRAPSRGAPFIPEDEEEESPGSTRLEHLLVTDRGPGSLESAPAPRPAEDTTDDSRPAKGNERASASRCFPSSITRSRA